MFLRSFLNIILYSHFLLSSFYVILLLVFLSLSHLVFLTCFSFLCSFLGLLSSPPDETLRRQIILIAKVLSNLSTHVLFGAKEEYMTIMNDFIESNSDSLDSYYAFISNVLFLHFLFIPLTFIAYFLSLFHLHMNPSPFLRKFIPIL